MAAWTCRASYSYSAVRLLLSVLVLGWASRTCFGLGSYGFDIHHRFSNPVKAILGSDELPEKSSAQYYAAMAHRDRLIQGRHLSTADDRTTPLAFEYGNITYRISAFGHLHYANVSVGTPSTSYLVALDTSSNMLWLPCDCSSCVRGFMLSNRNVVEFKIYSPNTSSTSKKISCNNTFCPQPQRCTSASSACNYRIEYRSNETSSTGVLVEDVLHLSTDDAQQKDVPPAWVVFGCGRDQTGIFLKGAAPNGLLGLGMGNVSIPSILARQGLALNSFSMCFGLDGIGRIIFGDNGSQGQAETPFNRDSHSYPTYNITITQIAIGKSVTNLEFCAIFDSGIAFTYLNDPAYTQITERFNSVLKNSRRPKDSDIPFEYCYYDIRPIQTVSLTMKGGKQYSLLDPLVTVSNFDESTGFYCLGVVKSDVNIIGQNFMTGYRVIFDREKMVLGWKESNCYNDEETVTFPVSPTKFPTASPGSVNPEATSGSTNTSSVPGSNHSPKLKNSFTTAITILLFVFFAVV